MSIRKDNMNVVGVYKGNTPIIKVYKGQSLVWQVNSGGGGEPVPSYHLTCTYDVTSTTAPTKVLNNATSFADTMYVDGEPMPKASGVTFSTTGTHTIGYNLSGNTLNANAFTNTTALTEVVFGDVNVTLPKASALMAQGQFYKCTKLEKVDMSRATITSLEATSSGYAAFFGCTSLTDVKLSNALTTLSGPVFINCTALESITIPSSVTALTDYTQTSFGGITQGTYGVFQGCTSLKEVIFEGTTAPSIDVHTFPNGNAGTFYYPCGSDYSAVASQLSMWTDGCTGSGNISTWSLRGVIDGSTTSVVAGLYNTNESDYIDKMMVDGVEVDKNTVTLQQYKDGKMHNVDFYFTEDFIPEDFLDIAQLAYVSVEVGEGITEIRDRAFRYMEITSATLPSTLTYISYDAFFRDYNLTSLTFNSTEPPMLYDEYVFTSVPDYCVLYVPDGSESAYESWKPNPYWTIDGYDGGAPPVSGDDESGEL